MPDARSVTYVSFAVPRSCLGVVILEGELDALGASLEAHRLGIHPGGTTLAISCKETDPDVSQKEFEVLWGNRNKLIPASDACILFDADSFSNWEQKPLDS